MWDALIKNTKIIKFAVLNSYWREYHLSMNFRYNLRFQHVKWMSSLMVIFLLL